MKALAARRRHPAAIAVLILLGLLVTGGAYSFLAPKDAQAVTVTADSVAQGKDLFLSNCASCHGVNAQGGASGPSLAGVGAASVDFQVGTGRMPLPAPAVQAQRNKVKFDEEQIAALASYVASLAPGPGIPDDEYTTVLQPGGENDERIARGGEIFRVNCAMCHNFAGAGGALTRGKYAPSLNETTPTHIYEAMVTGPQSMPVFSDTNISPESKQDLISYLKAVDNQTNVGGMTLGNLGPVAEGLFAWVFLLGILIACAVWLGKKAA
ncbi:cytochrome bc1 complex diheme cytochrome c subunit [Terracoccus luteus]|uniref:Cytochrome bc1 complex cytochrome c subunit n=1 Tax=Terracoccus luteus TaxID=53356 RepID=A0A495XZ69_9MICO|nr:cytochrome c [Terracoccus luteus]MBB2984949.1 ubiquinol-cytochrome c reductase cytochrome c subunit [Terracoccus luteus]MCP2170601.1 ubiquinol-cytochrome c reductase cytochrome c subunit [Terracoccus luteus]RKT77793.1 menaquinol-cytochrome c reductase cytochrome c1 subunit precursor [Terracoccus luteus]